jgi:hypothetical protein
MSPSFASALILSGFARRSCSVRRRSWDALTGGLDVPRAAGVALCDPGLAASLRAAKEKRPVLGGAVWLPAGIGGGYSSPISASSASSGGPQAGAAP